MKHRLFSVLFGIIALWLLLLLTSVAAAQNQSPQQHRTSKGYSVTTVSQPVQKNVGSEPADAEDREGRIRIANHLKQMGESVDWQKYDLLTLLDMESRVESARHLREQGVRVDWRKYETTLSDMEMRVEAARQLNRLGVKVDWRKHELLSLLDLQSLVETAQRLQHRGIAIELRKDGIVIPSAKQPEEQL